MSGAPKFFCANCGAEVTRHAKVCAVCGRFFAAVRCPACSASGTHEEFAAGCPRCGYLSREKNAPAPAAEKTRRGAPLPLWLYAAAVLALAAAASVCAARGLW